MTTYASLGHPAQIALSWLVNVGGRPWSSDLPSLHGLAADGYAEAHPDGTWTATQAGRDLLPAHMHRNPTPTKEPT